MRLLSRFMEPYGPFPSQQPGLADGVLLGPGRGSPNRGGAIALWQLLQNHGSSVHITSHPRLTTRLTGENRGLPPPILMRRTRGPCGAAGEVQWGSRASLTGFMRPGDAGSGGQTPGRQEPAPGQLPGPAGCAASHPHTGRSGFFFRGVLGLALSRQITTASLCSCCWLRKHGLLQQSSQPSRYLQQGCPTLPEPFQDFRLVPAAPITLPGDKELWSTTSLHTPFF